MRNIVLFILFGVTISCKSQTISLDQLSQCEAGNCPSYTSVKDLNNRLNKFIGVWKGNFTDGRTFEFRFTKKNDFSLYGGKPFDMIIGRMLIKNSGGSILENSLSLIDGKTHFNGLQFDQTLQKYQMYYSGNADCNDKGYVYLSFPDPNNLTQMRLYFTQDMDIIASCPSGYKTVMPDGMPIILTKQ